MTKVPQLNFGTMRAGADELAYFKIGSGPAVVIVHGVGGHKEEWQGVAQALGETHTVYALHSNDLRDHLNDFSI